MSTSSATSLSHTIIAKTVYNEIISGRDTYYYFFGRNLPFSNNGIENIAGNLNYENETRKNMVLFKKVNSSDIAHCAKRINWVNGTVYDMYDDSYHGGEITTISVTNGGSNYSDAAKIVIESPINGNDAVAVPVIVNGEIVSVNIISVGYGFTHAPLVTIVDTTGSGATFSSVISDTHLAYSGANSLDTANFYVLTDEYKVYKCIGNNGDSPSTTMPIHTSADPYITIDGYIWKFMYSIPNTLQNKWLTSAYMPVTTELTNSYYSNGGIDNVTIVAPGSGYTKGTATKLALIGDGFGVSLNPYVANGSIISVDVANGGTGVNVSTTKIVKSVSIVANVATIETYDAHKLVVGTSITIPSGAYSGTYVVSDVTSNNVFKAPIVTGNVTDDFGYIQFVTPTNTAKTITSIVRDNNIVTVTTSVAHGFELGIIATISGITPGGASTDLNGSFIIEQIVSTTVFRFALSGDNCSYSTGSVIFNKVGISSASLSSNVVTITCPTPHKRVIGNQVTIFSNNTAIGQNVTATVTAISGEYTFTYAKTAANTTRISHTVTYPTAIKVIGNGIGKFPPNSVAKVAPGILTNSIQYVGVVDPGVGYSSGNSVSISVSGDGSGASLDAVVSQSGQLDSIIINNPGTGYTYTNISVSDSGSGTGAKLVATTSKGNIDTLQYLVEIQAIDGAIYSIKMLTSGSGYTTATIGIVGDGKNAEAVATLNSTGEIVKIDITNPGYGYTFATINIVGNGVGATARAIMSPKGGHGRNAVKELYASNLIFFTNLNDGDTINGTEITNDYRQYGLLKNPTIFNSTLLYNERHGTTCYTVGGDFGGIIFAPDTVLRIIKSSTTYLFHVVACKTNLAIIIPLSGYIPAIGDTMEDASNPSDDFVVSSIIEPDVDKYSGDLIYLNNQLPFSQSSGQSIKSRTVIGF
jgi:hypothetical protein